jgi:hypothetical protein
MKVALVPEKLGEEVDDRDAMVRVWDGVETKAFVDNFATICD